MNINNILVIKLIYYIKYVKKKFFSSLPSSSLYVNILENINGCINGYTI